ncbi:hypothetical protein CP532_5655 [Ophiocordyceps camponoti-leonardi (nom. inval.)]|nr:hypothetical protein CP532_5655 [Ophiocordyceps camponoti-leonardi (nom. inval.)]
MSALEAVRYSRGRLQVLDQLRLPHEFHYDDVSTRAEAHECIALMRVRGAPAIAIVASLGLAVELYNKPKPSSADDALRDILDGLEYLATSRPTAVDLGNAVAVLSDCVRSEAAKPDANGASVIAAYLDEAEALLARDLDTNLAIAGFGADWLCARAGASSDAPVSILTHCNTGSLATSGHGTALGIVRTLHARQLLRHVFCTETRPYNQGSRLTAFELVYERIPSTLITDSMAAALFRSRGSGTMANIAAVIVGADRVVRNGDTANKIGTYQLAVLARYHKIPFIVAAPTTSIDLKTEKGDDIRIEERKPQELTQLTGAVVRSDGSIDKDTKVRIATADQTINVWNPAFDVTPAELIDVIVTEKGAVEKGPGGSTFDFSKVMPEQWAKVLADRGP